MLPDFRHRARGPSVLRGTRRARLREIECGSKAMDFRLRNVRRIRRFPGPEEGLRVMAEKAPQAEALAVSWITPWIGKIEKFRPLLTRIYLLHRRIATIAVLLLAAILFVHVMFGANGMVVYKQKRAEFQSLQKQIAQEQKENDEYRQQIESLKTDQKAIEREAREQLRYVRPGEFVYVPPPPPNPPANHSAKK